MIDQQLVAEAFGHSRGYLSGEGDFGQEKEDLPPAFERLVNHVGIDFGFSAGGDAVEEAHLFCLQGLVYGVVGLLLRISEREEGLSRRNWWRGREFYGSFGYGDFLQSRREGSLADFTQFAQIIRSNPFPEAQLRGSGDGGVVGESGDVFRFKGGVGRAFVDFPDDGDVVALCSEGHHYATTTNDLVFPFGRDTVGKPF